LERGRWGATRVVVGCKNLRKEEMGGWWPKGTRGTGGGQTKEQEGGREPTKGTRGRGRLGFGGAEEWASLRRIEINGTKPFSCLCSRPQRTSQTKFYYFTDVCLLKLQTPIVEDPKEKKRKKG
jgi:hypothetical protein